MKWAARSDRCAQVGSRDPQSMWDYLVQSSGSTACKAIKIQKVRSGSFATSFSKTLTRPTYRSRTNARARIRRLSASYIVSRFACDRSKVRFFVDALLTNARRLAAVLRRSECDVRRFQSFFNPM